MNKKNKFTLLELLVVCAIIVILAAILLPALNKARESAYSITCRNQVATLMKGVISYAGDYEDYLTPYSAKINSRDCPWFFLLFSYIGMDNYSVASGGYLLAGGKTPSFGFLKNTPLGCPSSTYLRTRSSSEGGDLYQTNLLYTNHTIAYNATYQSQNGVGGRRQIKLSKIVAPSSKGYMTEGNMSWRNASNPYIGTLLRHNSRVTDTELRNVSKETSQQASWELAGSGAIANSGFLDGHAGGVNSGKLNSVIKAKDSYGKDQNFPYYQYWQSPWNQVFMN